ncbi:MAG: C4-dicarboxylate transporter DctA [Opitutaceae bacterium]|jgi:aerobic C4-dicarboxylate transport protein|nr:C4-dicarboxylate transporter DctA [Opitutaceae bacterium]
MEASERPRPRLVSRLVRSLYAQVIAGIVLGILTGLLWPETAETLKPFGDGFIKLVKMIIGPVIFCTIVTGIGGMDDMKGAGRVGAKALLYFEVVSTAALLTGLLLAHVIRPGAGMNIDPASLDAGAVNAYVSRAADHSGGGLAGFLLGLIPDTPTDAFARGNILQILLVSLLAGVALSRLGKAPGTPGGTVTRFIEGVSSVLFGMVRIVTRLAPVGAFGAMAFTVGRHGARALLPMLGLVGVFYLTSVLFVCVVLGAIARAAGFNIFKFLWYLRGELLVVLGTSSSEAALPQLMQKLEAAGCSRGVTGLVVPFGYSFNLDGTNIYMTMAVLFIAQATNIELTLAQQLLLLGATMITSKGASGVTGAGFITLAATLAVVPTLPVSGMVLILGIDRFMSECRALTNITGNAVATVVVSAWERQLDRGRLREALDGRLPDAARQT